MAQLCKPSKKHDLMLLSELFREEKSTYFRVLLHLLWESFIFILAGYIQYDVSEAESLQWLLCLGLFIRTLNANIGVILELLFLFMRAVSA